MPLKTRVARVAELADALDLGSSGATRAGSSPVSRIRAKSFRSSTVDVKRHPLVEDGVLRCMSMVARNLVQPRCNQDRNRWSLSPVILTQNDPVKVWRKQSFKYFDQHGKTAARKWSARRPKIGALLSWDDWVRLWRARGELPRRSSSITSAEREEGLGQVKGVPGDPPPLLVAFDLRCQTDLWVEHEEPREELRTRLYYTPSQLLMPNSSLPLLLPAPVDKQPGPPAGYHCPSARP